MHFLSGCSYVVCFFASCWRSKRFSKVQTQQSMLSARWSSVGLLLSTPESQGLKPETEHAAPTSTIQKKNTFWQGTTNQRISQRTFCKTSAEHPFSPAPAIWSKTRAVQNRRNLRMQLEITTKRKWRWGGRSWSRCRKQTREISKLHSDLVPFQEQQPRSFWPPFPPTPKIKRIFSQLSRLRMLRCIPCAPGQRLPLPGRWKEPLKMPVIRSGPPCFDASCTLKVPCWHGRPPAMPWIRRPRCPNQHRPQTPNYFERIFWPWNMSEWKQKWNEVDLIIASKVAKICSIYLYTWYELIWYNSLCFCFMILEIPLCSLLWGEDAQSTWSKRQLALHWRKATLPKGPGFQAMCKEQWSCYMCLREFSCKSSCWPNWSVQQYKQNRTYSIENLLNCDQTSTKSKPTTAVSKLTHTCLRVQNCTTKSWFLFSHLSTAQHRTYYGT